MLRFTLLLGLIFSSNPTSGLDDVIVKNTEPFMMVVGSIKDRSMVSAINSIAILNKRLPKGVPIRIYLKSTGGLVGAGLAFIETIVLVRKTRPVYGIVVDRCASMCYTILQAMTKRFMNVDSYLFEHRTRAGGSPADKPVYTKRTRALDKIRRSYNRFVTPSFLGDEFYLVGSEALKYNIIDGIVNLRCEKKLLLRGLCPLTLGD